GRSVRPRPFELRVDFSGSPLLRRLPGLAETTRLTGLTLLRETTTGRELPTRLAETTRLTGLTLLRETTARRELPTRLAETTRLTGLTEPTGLPEPARLPESAGPTEAAGTTRTTEAEHSRGGRNDREHARGQDEDAEDQVQNAAGRGLGI